LAATDGPKRTVSGEKASARPGTDDTVPRLTPIGA
jgi:hypothetical protein